MAQVSPEPNIIIKVQKILIIFPNISEHRFSFLISVNRFEYLYYRTYK